MTYRNKLLQLNEEGVKYYKLYKVLQLLLIILLLFKQTATATSQCNSIVACGRRYKAEEETRLKREKVEKDSSNFFSNGKRPDRRRILGLCGTFLS